MQPRRSSRDNRRDLGRVATAVALVLLGAATSARAGTLDRIRDRGKLVVGYRSDARPFSYDDDSGKPAGYSVALCQNVANAVKAEPGLAQIGVEYVKIGSTDGFDALNEGTIDVLCGGAIATLERRNKVSFSIPIFPSGIGALLRKDAPQRLKDVLQGGEPLFRPRWRASLAQVLEKRVLSAQAGTTTEAWLAQKREEFNVHAEIVTVQSYREGIDGILSRRSDVLFGDRAILLEAAARGPSANDLTVLTRQYTYEPIALGCAREDDDFRLLIDRVLSGLYRSGEINGTYARFFGEPNENALAFFHFVALPE